jgi:glutathionylspermidine synthase
MIRKRFIPRKNWEEQCLEVGFNYFNLLSSDGSQYWREGIAYELSVKQVDYLEDSTNELHGMCMELVSTIIQSGDYPKEYNFSDQVKSLIERSWKSQDPHLYGRFDLAFDGTNAKMLEYNADTPTSLLEAAVVQWNWIEGVENLIDRNQFNSIHERLIERWKIINRRYSNGISRLHFTATQNAGREDWGNLEYLMDTAIQAGIPVTELPIENIGWDEANNAFVDLENKQISFAFKLYPWEWMTQESYGEKLTQGTTQWIEPIWKMILSNKCILPLLWDKYKEHPLLLPSYFDKGQNLQSNKWVRKPTLSREGANISMLQNGLNSGILPGSSYDESYNRNGYIIQQWVDLPLIEGMRPVIGSWVIGDEAAGIGIREDANIITGNDSHFVPHYFVE